MPADYPDDCDDIRRTQCICAGGPTFSPIGEECVRCGGDLPWVAGTLDCDGPGDLPAVHPDDATALLAAELRYRAALRERRDVTAALHDLQRVRVAVGLHAHLP